MTGKLFKIFIGALLGVIAALVWTSFIEIINERLAQSIIIGAICGGAVGIAMGAFRPYLSIKSAYFILPTYTVTTVVWISLFSSNVQLDYWLLSASFLSCCVAMFFGGAIGGAIFKNGL